MHLKIDTSIQPYGSEEEGHVTGTQANGNSDAVYNNAAFSTDDTERSVEEKSAKQSAAQGKRRSTKVLTKEERRQKWLMIKDIVTISFAFMCLFTSFQSMANLQSSINKTEGTASLSIVYAGLIISSLFLPTWLIRRLTAKWTIVVCIFFYATYIAMQFYPTIYTLTPAGALVGLAAAPLWTAKCYIITQTGQRYAALVGEDKEVIITRFFGFFFLLFQFSQVWGNLISSLVLSPGDEGEQPTAEEQLKFCGANFCQAQEDRGNVTLDKLALPPDSQIYLMSSIYLIFAFFSCIIVAVFVRHIERSDENQESAFGTPGLEQLVATFNHFRHPYQFLIFPLTVWTGVEQAFIGADFTAAYVSCGLGVHMIGYVMMCYGVVNAFCSLTLGPLVKLVGRVPIITGGAVINMVALIILLYWSPHPSDIALFYVIALLWGISDAVWQTQVNAFYGVIFPENSEAAFSNYKLWESIGFLIAYICSSLICVRNKITILFTFLALGITGYYTIEIVESRGLLKKDKNGNPVPLDKLLWKCTRENFMRGRAEKQCRM
ncbi:UNC93-like protein [Oratosquilla oratoria]|uniref:UNC93-like protein n=1 Tax=Oratosquilla oratoria TaxID=337810 RepID=UPI003F7627E1